jgi:hypothetical protein
VGFSLKKIGRGILGGAKKVAGTGVKIVKAAAPIAATVLPAGKIRNAARIISAALPAVTRIIKPLIGGKKMADETNKIEMGVRAFVEAIATMQGKAGIELVMHFAPVLLAVKGIYDAIAGQEKSVWVPLVRAALDNCIGDEEDALIGTAAGALIKINVPLLPAETVSDFLFGLLEQQLMKDAA